MRSEVQIFPDPPVLYGAIAQLGEHLLCKQGVVGSIPTGSTIFLDVIKTDFLLRLAWHSSLTIRIDINNTVSISY